MNQENTIKSMIPQRWLAVVAPASRSIWADRIVEKFKEQNPELFTAMGEWRAVPEDDREEVVKKVLRAADDVHREMRDERKSSH
ncbi:MAG: hypothetical protein J5478_01535 [Bacteroidales bacterium]|nr:hypothetical protein [Bacteroidales bacterium]